jgi:L-lysine 6-transaminase
MKNENLEKKTINVHVSPDKVQEVLGEYMLVDGYDITLDLMKSSSPMIYDSKHNKKYLDFFTFFASNPLGVNHPKLHTDEFIKKLGESAITKPSLSDVYPKEMAEFVETFFKIAVPSYFKYGFFISGGALAVENALKAAFDWKVRKNFKKGYKEEKGSKVIHYLEAFHGRTGYTMSLTNTDPNKIDYFPKFNWPRVLNPKITFPLNDENLAKVVEAEKKSLEQIKQSIHDNKDDIAALLIEPIQGEGGDHHFRKEYFVQLRELCDENEIIFIMDEVQTGIALTGKWWGHEHFVKPDIIAFGKKTQVCGILSTDRIDEVEENVFRKSGRINSTFGGNLVDMVRFQKILEIMYEDDLVKNCEIQGKYLLSKIKELVNKYPNKLSNGRGLGLFCAFSCKDSELRDKIVKKLFENGLMMIGCGEKTLRFRPPVSIKKEHIDEGMTILDKVIGMF